LEILKIPFPTVYYTPKFKKITIAKQKKKICSCLVIVDQGGQKHRIGKKIAVFFA
jgi:hypothetical protein